MENLGSTRSRVLWMIFSLALLPLEVWFFLVMAPVLFLLVLPLIGAVVIWGRFVGPEKQSSYREAVYAKVLALSAPSWLENLHGMLKSHLQEQSAPVQACSCVQTVNGKVTLVARFIAAGGSWSHSVKGTNMESALARMDWKLQKDQMRPKSALNLDSLGIKCAGRGCNWPCANRSQCPNRNPGQTHFVEVARQMAI